MKQTCISPPSEARVKGRGCSGLAGWLAVRQLLLLLARCLMIFSVYEYLNGAHEYGLKRARAHY